MDLDLHIHTTASDGTLRPSDVVRAAADAALDVIAVTDHDTIAGLAEALVAAEALAVHVIPAIEISTSHGGADLHILGYFVDPAHPDLVAHADTAVAARESRMRTMVERLRDQGVFVAYEKVREAATSSAAIGRPHLARALVAEGIVDSVPRAFDLYIGNDKPAYVPARLLEAAEAIDLIHRAGGVAVWAHPPGHLLDAVLPALADRGLEGVEVYRPRNVGDRVLRLEQAARSLNLLSTGGSDWHGPDDGPLGEFRVRGSDVADLLEAGGM